MLTVREPFDTFAVGDRIVDPQKAADVLRSHPTHVVRTHRAPAAAESAPEEREDSDPDAE